ncbi:MAG: hypothetical protein ACLQPD_13825 [Desulfomonilaceae bacterium]
MIYNVPLALLSSYPEVNVVIRSSDPTSLVKAALGDASNGIKAVQLLSPDQRVEELAVLPPSMEIDLCLIELHQEAGIIPVWSKLFKDRAARLVLPVVTGFSEPAKEALRAGLSVMLVIDQPDAALVGELKDLFVFFAREPDVKAPAEFFYSLFGSFLNNQVASLWGIQEEHPFSHRYVTDSGNVTLSHRLERTVYGSGLASFLANHKLNLFVRKEECCSCTFFSHCEGYFKLPRDGYSCSAIRKLFDLMQDTAAELRADLSQASGPAHTD